MTGGAKYTLALSALLPALSAALSASPFTSFAADLALPPMSSAASPALLAAQHSAHREDLHKARTFQATCSGKLRSNKSRVICGAAAASLAVR